MQHVFTEDGVDSSDFSACSDASDYEDQTRNLVRKLRIRTLDSPIGRCGSMCDRLCPNHQNLDSQRLEEMAASLKDRFKTLTDRLARFDAGDLASTQEEIASERELRSWWEERSGNLSTQVAQLLEQRKRQREEKRLEREMRFHQRRVQGLESYWEQFFEAECAAGVIDLLSAEQRCRSLEKELKKMVTDISPDLGSNGSSPSALPQLFSASPSSGARAPLAPSRELCAAAAVHRKIHMVEMEHKAKVNETLGLMISMMTDFCNGRFAEKERHIMAALEEKVGEMVRGPLEEQNVSWVTIAQMIETARNIPAFHPSENSKYPYIHTSPSGAQVLRFCKVARYDGYYRNLGYVKNMGGIGAHCAEDYETLKMFVEAPSTYKETLCLHCVERHFENSSAHLPVDLIIFDFDETLTLATFMPSDRDFDDLGWEACDLEGTDWIVEDLLSYNFESPFQSGRLTALRQMLQALSQRYILVILSNNDRGAAAVLNLLRLADLASKFEAIWTAPFRQQVTCGVFRSPTGTWQEFEPPVVEVADEKNEILHHIASWQQWQLPERIYFGTCHAFPMSIRE
eukprot:s2554_g4.t1